MNDHSEILSPKELRRYALQISMPQIGIRGQENIKNSKVLVIGAGGKGTSVLQTLAALGVGELGICDNYPVEEGDLSRQHLYGCNDIGKQKAIISRQKLLEINNTVRYKIHNVCLSDTNILPIIEGYDVLVDATDNDPAHQLISDAGARMGKPVVFASVEKHEGLITLLNHKKGYTFQDALPLLHKIREQTDVTDFSCHLTLLAITGGIMANETIKILVNMESDLNGNLLYVNIRHYSFRLQKIK